MELWILTVLALKGKLAAAADNLTRRALAETKNFDEDVFATCERIIELNDRKRRIVNMKVMCDAIESSLTEREYEMLKAYVKRSVSEIAGELSLSKSAVYRGIKKAMAKAIKALGRLHYDESAMQRDYGSMALCSRTYALIKRLKKKAQAKDSAKEQENRSLCRIEIEDKTAALASV